MNEISYRLNHIPLRVAESKYAPYLAILLLCLFVGGLITDPVRFRWVAVGTVTFSLFATTVIDVRKGIIAILIFLPFMAFLRRAVYVVSPYVKFDPIHLITPALALFIFLGILAYKERLSEAIKGNSLAKYVIALLGVFILQIFNPLQGNLLVGLGGALYYVIPTLWFFFALCFANNQLIRKLMIAIVVIGVVTSAYGLCQTAFGFLPFERYWIEHGGFTSLHVGRFIRAFSTFSSPEEWSRYTQIVGPISIVYFLTRKNPVWLLIFAFISFTTVMTASRSSVFGLAFSVLVVLSMWQVHRFRQCFMRLLLLVSIFIVVTILFSPPSREAVFQSESIFYTMGFHTARGFVDPVGETTFQSRMNLWSYLFLKIIPKNPLGYGLGCASIAARKFGGFGIGTDSYVFSIFVNSGIAGGLLFLIITFIALKKGIRLCLRRETDKALSVATLSIIAGLTLNNLFGNSFTLYSVAPIGWLLMGWIAREDSLKKNVDKQK